MIDLTGIPLFAQLGPGEAASLSAQLTVRTVPANQPIFWVGDAGSEFFVVRAARSPCSTRTRRVS